VTQRIGDCVLSFRSLAQRTSPLFSDVLLLTCPITFYVILLLGPELEGLSVRCRQVSRGSWWSPRWHTLHRHAAGRVTRCSGIDN